MYVKVAHLVAPKDVGRTIVLVMLLTKNGLENLEIHRVLLVQPPVVKRSIPALFAPTNDIYSEVSARTKLFPPFVCARL